MPVVEDPGRAAETQVNAKQVGVEIVPQPSANGASLRAGARRMLEALGSHHPVRLTRSQLATLARMKPTSGTFSTYLPNLRNAGYLDERDGQLALAPAGRAALGAGPAFQPLTADQVRDQWRSALRGGARRMLDILVAAHPVAAAILFPGPDHQRRLTVAELEHDEAVAWTRAGKPGRCTGLPRLQ